MAISSVESSAVSLPWGDMEHERRRTPRYPFDASIEMRVGTSQDQRTARVTGLSLSHLVEGVFGAFEVTLQ